MGRANPSVAPPPASSVRSPQCAHGCNCCKASTLDEFRSTITQYVQQWPTWPDLADTRNTNGLIVNPLKHRPRRTYHVT